MSIGVIFLCIILTLLLGFLLIYGYVTHGENPAKYFYVGEIYSKNYDLANVNPWKVDENYYYFNIIVEKQGYWIKFTTVEVHRGRVLCMKSFTTCKSSEFYRKHTKDGTKSVEFMLSCIKNDNELMDLKQYHESLTVSK